MCVGTNRDWFVTNYCIFTGHLVFPGFHPLPVIPFNNIDTFNDRIEDCLTHRCTTHRGEGVGNYREGPLPVDQIKGFGRRKGRGNFLGKEQSDDLSFGGQDLFSKDGFPLLGDLSVRERSVLQTGRCFGINEFHSRTVSKLALDLFDSAKMQKLHDLGDQERELLKYSAFLHDIGSLISFQNHHEHSCYIIRNSNLLGFNHREINIMANIARFHRKKLPRPRNSNIPELCREDRTIMRKLAAFLRLAESLDRGHAALIKQVRFTAITKESADLMIFARGDCQFESWGVKFESKHFGRVFGRKLNDHVVISEIPGE